MEVLSAFMASYLGFLTFNLTKYPSGKIGKKLPEVKFKAIQVSPHIKFHIKGRIIHMHHWLTLSMIIIASLFITNAFLDSYFTRSFLAGGILQGLSFPDYRRIIYRS
jgi:hypothetical protein